MIKEAIEKIVNKADLTYDEAYTVMNEIMNGESTPTQNAAFLAALSTKAQRRKPSMKSPAAPPLCGNTPSGWKPIWSSWKSSAPAETMRTASTFPPRPHW